MENEILLQILSELKSLNVRQSGVEQKLDGVERQQANLAEELMAFQEFTMQKFERLENGQKKTNLIIENEIRPSIQTLAEGQSQMQGQMDQMQGQMNQMQGQMNQMQGQIGRIEDKVTWHDDIIFKRVK